MNEYSLHELEAIEAITAELRALGWYPGRRYLCGCEPTALCSIHAERRALDHYYPETVR